jgi:hypothetical protein
VYCVIVFTVVIFAKLNSPTCNCNDTVVNWFIKEQFCNLTCMVYVYQSNKSLYICCITHVLLSAFCSRNNEIPSCYFNSVVGSGGVTTQFNKVNFHNYMKINIPKKRGRTLQNYINQF